MWWSAAYAIMFVYDKPEENFVDCVEYDYAHKYAWHYLDKQLNHDGFDVYYELHQDIIDRPCNVNITD